MTDSTPATAALTPGGMTDGPCFDFEGTRVQGNPNMSDQARDALREVISATKRRMAAESCYHCGSLPDDDGDHSCPCPYRDEECPDHVR